ncbi:Transcriptional corepressor [Trichinella pseudospiralis]
MRVITITTHKTAQGTTVHRNSCIKNIQSYLIQNTCNTFSLFYLIRENSSVHMKTEKLDFHNGKLENLMKNQ